MDFNQIAEDATPTFWRVDKLTAYLKSIMAGLSTFDTILTPFWAEVDEVIKYNGQHLVLEEYLNNTYDNTLRRIYIDENDVVRVFGVDLPLNGEFASDPIDLGINGESNSPEVDLGINSDATSTGAFNFTVQIPAALTGLDEDLLRRRLDRWVEASKRYDINYF